MSLNIDFIGGGKTQGDLAAYMATHGRLDVGALRPWIGDDGRSYVSVYRGGDKADPACYEAVPARYATLRRDEWKQLDEALLPAARSRLNGIQALIDAGLVYNLGNAMGTTVLENHTVDDPMEATVSMDGVTRGTGDRPNYGVEYLPIPIIHVDFEINMRTLEASRKLGNPLDTTTAEISARRTSEKLESMLFTNTTYAFDGGTIYSYLNHPKRRQVTLGTYGAWTASATSSAKVLESVRIMKQASIDAKHYGPWELYVPTNYEYVLDKDYNETRGNSIRSRILEVGGINAVKVVDALPASNVLLVEMSSETVRLVRGMGISNVEWQTEGNFVTKYKVMTIQVPQVRADQNGMCGVVHMA